MVKQIIRQLKPTKFILDWMKDDYPDWFDGYDTGENWQGWACPLFTLDQGLAIVKALDEWGGNARYDRVGDRFIVAVDDPDAPEVYPVTEYQGVKLYPIGARSWEWEKKELENVTGE